jgi:hypothetical protein
MWRAEGGLVANLEALRRVFLDGLKRLNLLSAIADSGKPVGPGGDNLASIRRWEPKEGADA